MVARRTTTPAASTSRFVSTLAAIIAGTIALSAAAAERTASAPTNPNLPDWAPKPPPNVIEDRFRVEVTLLNANVDTTLRIDESLANPGTVINAEEDLGLDDSRLMPLAEITLLPGDRHLVRISGMSLRRSASKVIDEEIFFDDEVYLPGERVDSELNLAMLGVAYGHRFIVADRGELTGTIGIQILEVEANALVRSRVIRDAESGVAPLPLVGLEGRFDFTRRWSAEGRVQYLAADVKDIDGSVLDLRAGLTWRMNPYLVFGLGYRKFTIDVDSRDEDTPGLVEMTIDGPQLFMRASL